jgi:hypothetical protein
MPAIEGDSHQALLTKLVALASEIGYGFEIAALAGGPEGICRHTHKQIVVAEHLTPNGRLAAGIHELAHALIKVDELAPKLTYAEEELVVESVVFSSCQARSPDFVGLSVGDGVTEACRARSGWRGLGRRRRVVRG